MILLPPPPYTIHRKNIPIHHCTYVSLVSKLLEIFTQREQRLRWIEILVEIYHETDRQTHQSGLKWALDLALLLQRYVTRVCNVSASNLSSDNVILL